MDHRPAASDRHLHDFAGPAASARRKPVPNGDQDIAVRDRRAANHDISVDVVGALAGKFEYAGGSREEIVEALARRLIGEAGTIFCSPKWQHRLQLPPERQRYVRGDLVRPIGDGRYETERGLSCREGFRLTLEQSAGACADRLQHIGNTRRKRSGSHLIQRTSTMPGDSDAEYERESPGGRRALAEDRPSPERCSNRPNANSTISRRKRRIRTSQIALLRPGRKEPRGSSTKRAISAA